LPIIGCQKLIGSRLKPLWKLLPIQWKFWSFAIKLIEEFCGRLVDIKKVGPNPKETSLEMLPRRVEKG